jgi:DNA-binding NarL/FixJ family response regulator
MATKIFITDDHYMVVEGIRSLLQSEKDIEWMGHAMNAASCLAYLQQHQPDVLFLDINLPDKSGIDLCRDLRVRYPDMRIIGLSSFNQQSYIEKMMQEGASGYVLKNATREEIIEAIETVMAGKTFMSQEAAAVVAQGDDSRIPVLTRREKEVLGLIAEGLTNNAIAEKLFISTTTVDTHRKNLLAKFDVRNTATLIRMAAQLRFI